MQISFLIYFSFIFIAYFCKISDNICMIIEFSCRNFRSIKEPIHFSMLASADKSLPYHLINKDFVPESIKDNILKFSCMYGDNGSGKSTFIMALAALQELIITNSVVQTKEKLVQLPHKLGKDDTTDFSILFEKNDMLFWYELWYDEENIYRESLYFWPNGRRAMIFERGGNSMKTTASFKVTQALCEDKLASNKLLLSLAAEQDPDSIIADVFDFFNKDLIFFNEADNNWVEYSAEYMESNSTFKKIVIDFLNDNHVPVKDIYAHVETLPVLESEIPDSLPEAYKKVLRTRKKKKATIKLIYKDFEVNFEEESDGVRRLIQFIGPVMHILTSDKILICDELERHLHPRVIRYLLNLFTKENLRKAQFIITTHNLDMMDSRLLRRDQIWFTYIKNAQRSTEIYRLSSLNGIRKVEKLNDNYMEDVYEKLYCNS